ncbi:MAG TPA: hypothetical protein PKD75_07685 [Tepidiformaceae bacterium]|nr:hypothetical protein [Tepidiformaceae bacterium]
MAVAAAIQARTAVTSGADAPPTSASFAARFSGFRVASSVGVSTHAGKLQESASTALAPGTRIRSARLALSNQV